MLDSSNVVSLTGGGAKQRSPLVRTVTRLGSVATREQLVARGYSGRALTAAVRSGSLLRLRRAWYATPAVSDECRTAVMLGGRMGGMSAARSYGWWDGLDDRVHVSWAPHGNVAKPGRVKFGSSAVRAANENLVVHWRTLRDPLDGESVLWRESPEQTLAQVLLSSDKNTAVGCADSAMRVGTLTRTQVSFVFSAMPRRIRRWERYIDERSDSGLESIVRVWLVDRGIPFVFHPMFAGIGEADFLVGKSLVIETDGREFHKSEAAVNRDKNRDNDLAIRGYIVIRWSYAMIMFDWAGCERRLLEHLGRGDHLRRVS